jgi:hypothetical protein
LILYVFFSSFVGPDLFGITYRPYGKQKKEYDMPAGPAFEDEAEFEKDLKTSDVLNTGNKPTREMEQGTGDDEFDFEQPVEIAVVRAGPISFDERDLPVVPVPSAVRPSVETSSAPSPSAGPLPEADSVPIVIGGGRGGLGKGEAIRAAAREAFKDITEVYSSGLGDHDMTIKNTQTHSTDDQTLKSAMGVNDRGNSGTIEEVDEEKMEREEREQARAKEEEELLVLNRLKALESQWSALDNFSVVEAQLSVDQSSRIISYKDAEKFFR